MTEPNAPNNDYSSKPPSYFGHVRHDAIALIQPTATRIAEIGCAKGATLLQIRRQRPEVNFLAGVDISADAIASASHEIDRVDVVDVETDELPDYINDLDTILCLDILEHLRNPQDVLIKLRPRLKRDGKMIISLPNVRHYSVSLPLLFLGKWELRDQGIMDRTHLRFYTKRAIIDLLEQSGCHLESITPHIHRRRDRILNRLTLGVLSGLFCVQYVIRIS